MTKSVFYDDYHEEELNGDYNFFIEQMIKSIEKKYSTFEKEIIISNNPNPFENEFDESSEKQNS